MNNSIIAPLDVAKVYLLAELGKIFPGENIQKELPQDIAALSEEQVWRLLEALSFTYRLNGVFWIISDTSFVWTQEILPCANVVLTGMNPQVDAVTHSPEINRDPLKFRDYLLKYFEEYPTTDPEGLEQFRPGKILLKNPTILVTQNQDKFYLLDGSNRFIAQLLNGKTEVNAIVGRKNGQGKIRIGDSTFWLLRHAYERCTEEAEKQAILLTVKKLMGISSDGKHAVQTYWVEHVMDQAQKKVGEQLLLEVFSNIL